MFLLVRILNQGADSIPMQIASGLFKYLAPVSHLYEAMSNPSQQLNISQERHLSLNRLPRRLCVRDVSRNTGPLHDVKFGGLTIDYTRAFDTTTDAIWNSRNKGVRITRLSIVCCTNVLTMIYSDNGRTSNKNTFSLLRRRREVMKMMNDSWDR